MPTNYSFTADTTSASVNSGAVTAGGATLPIGGATPSNACIRFNSSTVVPADTIVSSTLYVKVSAQGAIPINIDAYAVQFGAAITTADINLAANNSGIAEGNTTGWVVYLKQILGTTAVVGTTATIVIPSRFIIKGSTYNSGFSDFELRPGTSFVAGATALTTIHGPAAVTSSDKPTLAITTLTATELLAQNSYRNQEVGVETWVGFAQEATIGTPVKAKVLLDITSSTLDSYAVNLRSQSLSKQRAKPRKLAVGRAGAGGSVQFEVTPEKWVQLLPGLLKLNSSTGSGPYVHTFKIAQSNEIKGFTFVQKTGDFRQVFPGTMLDSLSLTANLDEPVKAGLSVQSRSLYEYDSNAAGTSDEYILSATAAYDTVDNTILSFVGAQVTFDGVVDRGLVQNVSITFRQGLQERRGLNRQRDVTSHYAMGFECAVSFSMYFEDVKQLQKFLGIGHTDFPNKAAKSIQFQALQFDFAGQAGPTTQNINITIPKMMYETVRSPINGEGAIMLDCSGVAAFDDISALTNVTVVVTNSESSTVYNASTEAITVQPAPLV